MDEETKAYIKWLKDIIRQVEADEITLLEMYEDRRKEYGLLGVETNIEIIMRMQVNND